MFVGNDSDIIRITGRILQRNGYDICCATEVDEVKENIKKFDISLLIADLEMEDEEKKNFFLEIRRKNPRLRLILISKNAEDEVPSLYGGADSWLKKPYDIEVLLARISVLLRQDYRKAE